MYHFRGLNKRSHRTPTAGFSAALLREWDRKRRWMIPWQSQGDFDAERSGACHYSLCRWVILLMAVVTIRWKLWISHSSQILETEIASSLRDEQGRFDVRTRVSLMESV